MPINVSPFHHHLGQNGSFSHLTFWNKYSLEISQPTQKCRKIKIFNCHKKGLYTPRHWQNIVLYNSLTQNNPLLKPLPLTQTHTNYLSYIIYIPSFAFAYKSFLVLTKHLWEIAKHKFCERMQSFSGKCKRIEILAGALLNDMNAALHSSVKLFSK